MTKILPSDIGDETFLIGLERMLDRQRAEDREYLAKRFDKLEVLLKQSDIGKGLGKIADDLDAINAVDQKIMKPGEPS